MDYTLLIVLMGNPMILSTYFIKKDEKLVKILLIGFVSFFPLENSITLKSFISLPSTVKASIVFHFMPSVITDSSWVHMKDI